MDSGGSGAGIASATGYLTDLGFWASVVIVNLVVATVLVLVGAPGYRR
jgi:hypothetical protein